MSCIKIKESAILPNKIVSDSARLEAIRIGLPVNLLVEGEGGQILNTKLECSSTYTICIINTVGNRVGLIGTVENPFTNLETDLEVNL